MRLNYVEMCGFRGFHEKVRVVFGESFTIITGRNGVGKSTVCDAVEFALTGSIDKYTVEKAARESLSDYLWWRGDVPPKERYVTLSFLGEDGKELTIKRTPDSSGSDLVAQVEAALCTRSKPERAIEQLCRTSIIRDEWIAALSLDLTDTARFDLVRSALGHSENSDYINRAKEVAAVADAEVQRLTREYEQGRGRLTTALTQLSETRETASRSKDVDAAIKVLSAALPDGPSEIVARLSAGRTDLARRRARLRKIELEVPTARELAISRQAFDTPQAREQRSQAEAVLAQATLNLEQSRERVTQAEQALALMEKADALAGSLAALVDHGEHIGLNDGHCPLCDARVTPAAFEKGLALARQRAEELAAGVSEARKNVSTTRAASAQSETAYQQADSTWRRIERERINLDARMEVHELTLGELDLGAQFAVNAEALQKEHDAERDRLIEIERALLTLEASHAVSRVAASEDRVAVARRDSDVTTAELTRWRTAAERARTIERAIKRVGGEIIDERLAQISPLLNELYQRLRPHTDWRTIEYSIRGDVRRFLSLKVGNGLNPQFVFSSGQRRAAGLAFLLAVHLARNWTTWRTLILDDPIQHIDDFRALHLVEVLASLRREGRQIVCAVEDEALAELLCRRLSGTEMQSGRKYTLEFGSKGSAVVASSDVPPLPRNVLRGTLDLQAAAG